MARKGEKADVSAMASTLERRSWESVSRRNRLRRLAAGPNGQGGALVVLFMREEVDDVVTRALGADLSRDEALALRDALDAALEGRTPPGRTPLVDRQGWAAIAHRQVVEAAKRVAPKQH